MTARNYFNKNRCIYGITFEAGSPVEFRLFRNLKSAERWMNHEECSFRERELCSKSRAAEYIGLYKFNYCMEAYEHTKIDTDKKNQCIYI